MIYIIILIVFIFFYSLGISYILKFFNKIKNKKITNDIYLTFDDGPSNYTNSLLDLLNKYNVKATFFVVGEFVLQHESIIKRMKDDGHQICLHSLDHKSEVLKGPIKTIRDFNKSVTILKKYDIDIKCFRAPWGQFNIVSLLLIKLKKIRLTIWDVMAEDWENNTNSKTIEKKLLNRTNGGDIICLHDGRGFNEAPKRTIKALEKVIPIWLEKGFKFKTMDDYYE